MKSFVCRPLGFVRKKHMETDMITVFDEIKRNLGKKEKTIIFKNGKNDVSLSADKIIAIEVYGHKMILILKTRTIQIKDSISRVEEELTRYHFIKISRNRMINFKYVKEIEKNKIILADEYEFCVSKNRLKYVEEEWLKYKCFF
jgi:DNA-binding LytR/AlgR family response regulator